jgi:ribosomal protein L11
MKFLLIATLVFLSWYIIDLDYDARDPHSLDRMMKWAPFSALTLLQDIEIAADNPNLTNLHGLNADQIHDIANERRTQLNSKQIDLIKRRNNGEYSIHKQ